MKSMTGTSLFAAAIFIGTTLSAALGSGAAMAQDAMPTSGRTSQPIGHYEFCQRDPGECSQKTPAKPPVELTRDLWSAMLRINAAVNAAVKPMTDMQIWGKEEVWSYPVDVGDCEDYALEKRRELMRLGVAAGDLLIAVARQPSGAGHAVLTVRTNRGDYILDNLDERVVLWSQTPYTYLKRQSERNSGAWIAVNDDRSSIAVGSVR